MSAAGPKRTFEQSGCAADAVAQSKSRPKVEDEGGPEVDEDFVPDTPRKPDDASEGQCPAYSDDEPPEEFTLQQCRDLLGDYSLSAQAKQEMSQFKQPSLQVELPALVALADTHTRRVRYFRLDSDNVTTMEQGTFLMAFLDHHAAVAKFRRASVHADDAQMLRTLFEETMPRCPPPYHEIATKPKPGQEVLYLGMLSM